MSQVDLLRSPTDEAFFKPVTSTPTAVWFVYMCIALYSVLCNIFFSVPFYEIYIWYVAGLIGFMIWHWFAHQKWTRDMHRYHMDHHLVLFPPRYFFGNPKVKPELLQYRWIDYIPLVRAESFWHEFPMYAIGALIVYGGYFIGATKVSIICGLVELVVVGLVGNSLHNSFHIKGHWLERFDWYHQIRALHYLHHQGSMKHNFSILNFRLDKLLHLYQDGHDEGSVKQDLKEIDHESSPLSKDTKHYVKHFERATSFHNTLLGLDR
jgi:hypothetical protein